MEDFELLEKYIKGQLKGNDLTHFEARLKTEQELSEQLELLQKIKTYAFEKEKSEVQKQLKNIREKHEANKNKTKILYLYPLIAASIALFIYFTFTANNADKKEQKLINITGHIDTSRQTEKQLEDSIPVKIKNNTNQTADKTESKTNSTKPAENSKIKTKKTYYVLDYSKISDKDYGFVPQAADSFKITVVFYQSANNKYKRKKDSIFLQGNFNEEILFYKESDDNLIIMQYKNHKYFLEESNYYKDLK